MVTRKEANPTYKYLHNAQTPHTLSQIYSINILLSLLSTFTKLNHHFLLLLPLWRINPNPPMRMFPPPFFTDPFHSSLLFQFPLIWFCFCFFTVRELQKEISALQFSNAKKPQIVWLLMKLLTMTTPSSLFIPRLWKSFNYSAVTLSWSRYCLILQRRFVFFIFFIS